MELKQHHFLWLAFAVVAGLLFWDIRQKYPKPAVVTDTGQPNGGIDSLVVTPGEEPPNYLTYNQPYAFAPPVVNILPETTDGQIGQSPKIQICC